MEYQFYTCDVFTDLPFKGNQLAVIPNAQGLSKQQMQKIAREFNFSESTFVFPPENGYTKKVRIFTPATEVDFAGHPNIGTAFVLATIGELGEFDKTEIVFEEKAGLVPITIEKTQDKKICCELKAPQDLSVGITVAVEAVAAALSLEVADIRTDNHPPQLASVGLPFIIVELKDQSALANAKINMDGFERIHKLGIMPDIFMYVRDQNDINISARMFAPLDGIMEDPATGSACCALTALLTSLKKENDGMFKWKISQGKEMGRPSLIMARTEKNEGKVSGVWISGNCVMVSKGTIYVE